MVKKDLPRHGSVPDCVVDGITVPNFSPLLSHITLQTLCLETQWTPSLLTQAQSYELPRIMGCWIEMHLLEMPFCVSSVTMRRASALEGTRRNTCRTHLSSTCSKVVNPPTQSNHNLKQSYQASQPSPANLQTTHRSTSKTKQLLL